MARKPVLYLTILSPPVRAVLLTAKALGVELELKELNLFEGEHLKPEFLKINPQHTVPTLDDNDTIIYDSQVIASYLVDKYGQDDSLYPRDFLKRTEIQSRLYYISGFIFPRARFLFEPIIFHGSKDLPQEKIKYIQETYSTLEAFLQNNLYLCGNELTIADLCCISIISSLHPEFAPIDKTKYPKLLEWFKVLEQLPYYEEANKIGAEAVKKFVIEKLAANRAK